MGRIAATAIGAALVLAGCIVERPLAGPAGSDFTAFDSSISDAVVADRVVSDALLSDALLSDALLSDAGQDGPGACAPAIDMSTGHCMEVNNSCIDPVRCCLYVVTPTSRFPQCPDAQCTGNAICQWYEVYCGIVYSGGCECKSGQWVCTSGTSPFDRDM